MSDSPASIDLLRRWHRGDRRALEELLARNLDWMRARVRWRLGDGLRRMGETQDFVHDAMVHVLEYGPRFEVEDEERFRRLLARIIENTLRGKHRFMRRERRDPRRERPLASDTILRLDPPRREVTRPSQHHEREENAAWVRLALEFLDPRDREVLWRHEYDGQTFAAIGEALGMTESGARMRFQRALPRLAERVAELQAGRIDAVLDSGSEPGDAGPEEGDGRDGGRA